MKRLFLSAVLALATGQAFAQAHWDGFYAGVLAGGGSGEREAIGSGWTAETGGALLGGVIGYTLMTSPVLLGVEADYQLSNIDFHGGTQTNHSLDHFGTIRGLAGVAIDDLSVYGTAGLAMGGAYFHPNGAPRNEQYLTGWAFGAGAKYQISESMSIMGDALHVDFGQPGYFSMLLGNARVRTSDTVLRAGVLFHF